MKKSDVRRQAHVFSCKYCGTFKNTYFTERIQVTSSLTKESFL